MLPDDFTKLNPEQKDTYYVQIYNLVNVLATSSNPPNSNQNAKGLRAPIDFAAKVIPTDTQNLIIGSSFLAEFDTKELLKDVAVHSYRGSFCSEKQSVVKKYDDTELKSVTFQDGTNSLTRELHKPVDDIFETFCATISEIETKFSPTIINICQVPPVKSGPDSVSGKRITEFNSLIAHKFKKKKYQIVPIYDKIVSINDYQSIFFDEVHLMRSVSTLKNAIMEKVLPLSSLSPRVVSPNTSNSRGPAHPQRNRMKPGSSQVSWGPEHPKSLESHGFSNNQTYNYMNTNRSNYDLRHNRYYPY